MVEQRLSLWALNISKQRQSCHSIGPRLSSNIICQCWDNSIKLKQHVTKTWDLEEKNQQSNEKYYRDLYQQVFYAPVSLVPPILASQTLDPAP